MILIKKKNSGFTLVELLIVVAIITIIAGFIVTAVFNARSESRDQSRQTDLQQFKLGIKLYKETYGEYPDYPDGAILGVGGTIDNDLEPFVEVKSDPLSEGDSGDYNYWYFSDFTCGGNNRNVLTAETVEGEKYQNTETVCSGGAEVDHDRIIPVS